MNKLMLLSVIVPLAGCAGTTEKAAEAAPAEVVAVVSQPPAPVIHEPVPVVVAPVQPEVAQTDPTAVAEPTGWDELSRRLIAWGDPVRHSMEQYCLPKNTIPNP